MTRYLQEGTGHSLVSMEATLEQFEDDLLHEQEEVIGRKEARGHVTGWNTKQGILRVKGAARSGEESPTTWSKEYEALRGALSDCNRYVSLFHRPTAEDLPCVFDVCLFGGVFVLFGLCFLLVSEIFQQLAVFPHVLVTERPSQLLSGRVRQWIKKIKQNIQYWHGI